MTPNNGPISRRLSENYGRNIEDLTVVRTPSNSHDIKDLDKILCKWPQGILVENKELSRRFGNYSAVSDEIEPLAHRTEGHRSQ